MAIITYSRAIFVLYVKASHVHAVLNPFQWFATVILLSETKCKEASSENRRAYFPITYISSITAVSLAIQEKLFTWVQRRPCSFCLSVAPTICTQPLPKRVLHGVRASVSSLNLQYIRLPSRSSSSCLRLLPHIPVPSIFPAVTLLEDSSYSRPNQSN
jgi:hypothetical protein